MGLSRAVSRWMIRFLTKPLPSYTVYYPNNLDNLRRHIRKGDVILIEGNNRASAAIK